MNRRRFFGKSLAATAGVAAASFLLTGSKSSQKEKHIVYDMVYYFQGKDSLKGLYHILTEGQTHYAVPIKAIVSHTFRRIEDGRREFTWTLSNGLVVVAHPSGKMNQGMTLFKCVYGCSIRSYVDGSQIFSSPDPKALDKWPVTWVASHLDDVFTAEYPVIPVPDEKSILTWLS